MTNLGALPGILIQLVLLKAATWVQTIGAKHFQISVVDKGAHTAPLGNLTVTGALQLAATIAAGQPGVHDVNVGHEVYEVTIQALPST